MTDLKPEGGETQNKPSEDSKGFCNVGHSFKHHMFDIIRTHKDFLVFPKLSASFAAQMLHFPSVLPWKWRSSSKSQQTWIVFSLSFSFPVKNWDLFSCCKGNFSWRPKKMYLLDKDKDRPAHKTSKKPHELII